MYQNLTQLLFIVMAGLMNGSFLIPSKYLPQLSQRTLWCYHSLVGLILIPWLMLFVMFPEALDDYAHLEPHLLGFLIVSGAIFGLGQGCFASAIQRIGMALSFVINISVGLVLGSLFVVFFESAFLSWQGFCVSAAIVLILGSLILYYYATCNRSPAYRLDLSKHRLHTQGWILAFLAGLASGLQNISFFWVAFQTQKDFQATNSFWVWPPFLSAAALTLIISFAYCKKASSMIKPTANNKGVYALQALKTGGLITLMGLFFTGSLALYSQGMSQLSPTQKVIGWPAFMVAIIFSSQFWEWRYPSVAYRLYKPIYRLLSLTLLLLAILVLATQI